MTQELLDYFNGDELAASTWLKKYALEEEKTPIDMHKRIAKELARIETKYPNSISEQEIFSYLDHFKYIIPGGSIMSSLGNSKFCSLSNCTVLPPPEDSVVSILDTAKDMANLMKRRAGVGFNLNKLRPEGAKVSNASKTSTGAVSFMDIYSNVTETIAMNGRRGALLLSMSINHPDILSFITKKQDLTKVTGANVSVQLNKEFMKVVDSEDDYILRFPIDIKIPSDLPIANMTYNELFEFKGNYFKKIKAKELWKFLITCAYKTGEPGVLFEDNIANLSPENNYNKFKFIGSNPCGEQLLGAYDACRLIHINLSSFVINPFTEDSFFDFDNLDTICRKIVRLGDDIVDLELESILKILNKTFEEKNTEEYNLWNNFYKICEKGRRIGIGFTGLADVFAMLNIKYGSEESLQLAEKISEFMFYSELDESIELAKERGKFPDFDLRYENTNWHLSLKERNINLYNKMLKYGRRNLSFSTIAPTGTVSLMARTSSGIEPVFMNYYKRRRKCSSKEDKVDFIDVKGEKFTEFLVIHPKFEQWCKIKNPNVDLSDEKYLDKLYKDSPYYGATALEIDWKFKTKLVGKIQKNITNAISNTTNLPENITLEDVYDVYKKAWECGCKGLTIYRTNSRNGVLVERDKSKKPENLERKGAPKRPDILPSDLYVVTARGEQFIVVVGLYENKPYEIFVYRPNEKVNYSNHSGFITKIKKGVYKFKSDKITIPNLLDSRISLEESANTLYTSILLRHGVELKFIIKTAKKVDDQIVSFSSAMCRILNKYIQETEILEEKCPECGNSLIKTGGCIECKNCGYSKCG